MRRSSTHDVRFLRRTNVPSHHKTTHVSSGKASVAVLWKTQYQKFTGRNHCDMYLRFQDEQSGLKMEAAFFYREALFATCGRPHEPFKSDDSNNT